MIPRHGELVFAPASRPLTQMAQGCRNANNSQQNRLMRRTLADTRYFIIDLTAFSVAGP